MIRHPIPFWLFVGLGLLGFVVLGGVYAGLSVRQTRINPEQTILPGVKGLSAGFHPASSCSTGIYAREESRSLFPYCSILRRGRHAYRRFPSHRSQHNK